MSNSLSVTEFQPTRKIVSCTAGEIFNAINTMLGEHGAHQLRHARNYLEPVANSHFNLIAAQIRLRAIRTLHPHASRSRGDSNVERKRLIFR